MLRRDLFKLFTAGLVLPSLTPEVFAFFREMQPGKSYALRTLTPHQNDTVVAMIDQIIPATDTPGAKAARVNEFIDIILTEWATPEERDRFLTGLTDVDKQSKDLFTKNFTDASPAQQLTLLRAMDESVAARRTHRAHHPSVDTNERDTQLKNEFFSTFKGITLHGYYTSEIGFTQELKLQIIPGAQHGCTPLGPGLGDA